MAEADDFFLTEMEVLERFHERVLPFIFPGRSPRMNPVLIIVGAQPAAGKSHVIQQCYAGRDTANQWLARYRDVLTHFAAAGAVNPTTAVALQRVVRDADAIVAMAHPARAARPAARMRRRDR